MARSQLDLFPRDLLDPAPATAEQAALALALPTNLHLGTSSWTFPGWQGLVYAHTASKAKLASHGHPTMPGVAEQRRMVDAAGADAGVVVRWMLGGNQKYEAALERYAPFDQLVDTDRDSRATIAALCAEALDAGRPAFVTVNNKAEGSAPLSVFALAAAIREAQRLSEETPKE